MKRPEPFELFQPTSLREASEIQREKGAGGYFLAGGTDLAIAIKQKGLAPRYVVDLEKIPLLSGIRENPDGSISIGALTTLGDERGGNFGADSQTVSVFGAECG